MMFMQSFEKRVQ